MISSVRSVTESCPTLWPCGLQHARLPCQSPIPRVYSNSCPSSWWCHPTISPSLSHAILLLPSIFPSIRAFSNESVLHIRWPKYEYPFEYEVPKNSKEIKKAFLNNQCKEIEENNGMGKTIDLFKKIWDTKGIFYAWRAHKGQKWYGPNRSKRY